MNMNKPILLQALKLELPQVADWLGEHISALLGRQIILQAAVDDYDYWAVNCTNDRFSLADLCLLLAHVNAPRGAVTAAIPSDAHSTVGIDMDLANLLLTELLHTNWEGQLIQPEALYLIGIDTNTLHFPEEETNEA